MSGIAVWLDGYRPENEPRWSRLREFRPRIPPPLPTYIISRNSSYRASTPSPTPSQPTTPTPSLPPTPRTFIPSKTQSLNSSTSSFAAAPLSASSSSEKVGNKATATPAADVAYLQLDWESYLLTAAFEPTQAAAMSNALAQAGYSLPSDPRKLPWDDIKLVPGVKLGMLTKLRKYVDEASAAACTP